MTGHSRLAAAALVGGLVFVRTAIVVRAQDAVQPVGRVASLASGSIRGTVQDETGAPVAGAMVSALGATTAFGTTDRAGRFELRTLSPGPYLVRAHLGGYVAPHGQIVQIRPRGPSSSSISLPPLSSPPSYPVLAAGLASDPPPEPDRVQPDGETGSTDGNDDHSETAWRLRHARRGVLKDVVVSDALFADDREDPPPVSLLGHVVGSPAR